MLTAQLQIIKRQTQCQAVSGSDIYLSKAACVNIGLNPLKVPTDVPSDLDPHASHLQTKTQFVTSLSCELEPDITIPTSHKIFILADLDPDMSDGLDPGQEISRLFRIPLLLDSS